MKFKNKDHKSQKLYLDILHNTRQVNKIISLLGNEEVTPQH